jgi:hypothetical protein
MPLPLLALLGCPAPADAPATQVEEAPDATCDCTDPTPEIDALRQEIALLRAEVATFDSTYTDALSRIEGRVEDVAATTSDLVVSAYVVDCGLGSLQAAWTDAYSAARAAGDVTGLEWSYNSCILVSGVPEGEMPVVSAYQIRGYQPDVTCDSTTLVCTAGASSNQYWLLSQTGGMDGSRNGYGEARVPPGSQLRYDMDRGIITTASDMRQYKVDAENYWYVTVVGSKTYEAPVQPL